MTMGQIIKKLRKERNFTQEELAEQLNVTYQAVSKWENETGMPDISQIVPLASVFGVSTDVLFGIYGTNDNDEVRAIIEDAYKIKPGKAGYDALMDGLQRYPNNIMLLVNTLEYGMTLAYPHNDCYDEIHGEEMYRECIRQANLIISYAANTGDVLRAKMITVLLHSAHGNREKALEYAEEFPTRSDMTDNAMFAYIAHNDKDYEHEAFHCEWDVLYHGEALVNSIAQLNAAYRNMGKPDAIRNYIEELKIKHGL